MSMAAERWLQTCELFHELSALDEEQRSLRLQEIGRTDVDLQTSVAQLLAADDHADEKLAHLQSGIAAVLQQQWPRPVAADPLRLAGTTVAHFHIHEAIAAGGMGVVYRARDLDMQREVALKLPLFALPFDAHARARFLREARAIGSLDHANLCSVYEVGETEDGRLYLAMPLYAGETLKERIARAGALPVADALEIVRQISAGLAFAHAAGVVHRDLKPGNIMLLPDGTVKILDFGLALPADAHTITTQFAGTVAYMAPEQRRGEQVDARADLWSLGVLWFEMLTGVRPDEATPPSMHVREIPRSVDTVVLGLLHKDPAQRYQSARQLLDDIALIDQGRAPRRRAVDMRHRRTALAAALLAILVLVPAAFIVPDRLQPRPTDNDAAYQFYLRADQYETTGRVEVADTLFRRAIALDPGFALARGRLAALLINNSGPRPSDAIVAEAGREAQQALQAEPRLAVAHFAMGRYWQQHNDHRRALQAFERARKGMKKESVVYASIGTSYRSLGEWDRAVEAFEKAIELDPQNVSYLPSLAMTYSRVRKYQAAQRTWTRFIEFTPDAYWAMLIKGHTFVRSDGTADTLDAILRRIPPDWDANGMATFARVGLARLQRRPQNALTALANSKHDVSEDDMLLRPRTLLRAWAYEDMDSLALARANYDSARVMVDEMLARHPGDPRLHIAQAFALAGLGQKDAAMRAAEQAMALRPLSANIVAATCNMGSAAEVFAYLGENERAIALLDQLLRLPAGREASVPLLRVEPAYARLRADPRFQALLARHSKS
jgi:tetratricopeptide (TPR) repeat protein